MRLVRLALLIMFPFMYHAQSDAQPRLTTLQYPPDSSEHLSGGGSLVELTRRAFAVEGHEVQIDFIPSKDGEPDWRSIFERSLGILQRSGEYQQIIRRYQR